MVKFFISLLRLAFFWAIPVLAVACTEIFFPLVNYRLAASTIVDAIRGNIDLVSEPAFAYALAAILACFAAGLAVAFFLLHVVPVLFTLWRATRLVSTAQGRDRKRAETRRSFAINFESLNQRLESNWLIGHAWIEFEETLFDKDSDRAIGNTVRPQVFFNPGLARERLGGLKMMNAVPGYFVGIGLLLTFVGLVFALYKAGAAASAGDADIMAAEMAGLLRIATFKFSTSIAGLAASIVLSIFFRWFFILIEGSFGRFNALLERGLLYAAPQAISMEMSRTMQEQLVQLKDITQGEFFARMGSEIAPRLNAAIADAMAPVTEQIGNAVGNLSASSQDGVQKMLESFTNQLQHGAGTEMRELAATLKQLQMSMVEMQGGLRGSGDDFSAKLAEAAENMNRMVERAGQSFETSSGQSRDALTAVVETLRQTMEKANAEMDASLGAAAGGASAKLEAAMGLVMEKLDRQIGQIGESLTNMQRTMGEQGDYTRQQIEASVSHSAEIQKSVLADLQETVGSVSAQLRNAVEEALASVGQRFGELSTSMRAIEGALMNQKVALETTAGEARKTAQAFGESATSVRTATAPLVTVSDKFSGATERMATGVESTLKAIEAARDAIATLAAGLGAATERSSDFWTEFTAKFDAVDTALGRAVETLSRSTSEQQDRLQSHVRGVDQGLSEAIGKLSPFLAQIKDSAEAIADSLEAAHSHREAARA
ncbi:Mg2+ and Co2+ transporter CorA [Chelatococcus caeni]|uniref:Mg2+ and Co2+ transporter CorA n=1 Tax=Chelatococcus caeni TaxID=1348468 RepID=A0A840BWI8_9HYPH|nr:Mg2+ and Co2+ transporter CorA [Chelatococcus caeni]